MKKHILATTITLISLATFASAQDHHDKPIPGPKGGKVIETDSGHVEFFVQPDAKVSVTFYDGAMKPVAPAEQVVAVVAEAPSGREKLEFEKSGDAFVSTSPLPKGDDYRVVLQIKSTADAKPQNIRIDYHTEVCGKCNRPEYACICTEEAGGGHDGHGH